MEPSARRHLAMEFLKAVDLVLLTAGFVGSLLQFTAQRPILSWHALASTHVPVGNLLLLIWLLITWHVVFRITGAYQSHRFTSTKREVLGTVKSCTAGVATLSAVSLLARWDLSPYFFPLLWLLVTPAEVSSRVLLRALLFAMRRRGRNLRTLLVVGTGHRAVEFSSRLGQRSELGYSVLGFVGVGPKAESLPDEKVVCSVSTLARYLRDNVVDEVAVCLPVPAYYDEVLAVARVCQEQGILLRIHGDLFDSSLRVTRMDQFEGDRLLTVTRDSAPMWASLAKLLFDLAGSAALILLALPVFLAAVLAVKWSSPGPVFFTQVRLGRNKRRFRLYKFRTMVTDAEQRMPEIERLNEAQGPVFKMRNDPRVTPIGRWLRKLSIDELPQLFNVLLGDMSLVGPRPLPVRDYSGFSHDWHLRRFSVRPGISCLWQISGRSEIGFDEWMELDMKYIDQWSLWLDLKILAKTIPAVVRGAGAY